MDKAPGSLPAGVRRAGAGLADVGAATRAVILVEGQSDRVAVEVLADRRGRDLAADGVVVVPTGGATAIAAFAVAARARGVRLAGLYDVGEARFVTAALHRIGLDSVTDREGLEARGFYACVDDLEDELIRAVGVDGVETVLERQGDLTSFRRFQRQPAQRDRPLGPQLHRFMGTRSGRKSHYAALLCDALDLAAVPPPLDGVLADV